VNDVVAELSQALTICHAHGQPVVTQGGLTGCVEGADARPEEVIISLERMNTIEAIEPKGCTATVQAGVILELLQNTVAEQGLLFPLDLGARGSCTIGGNIATNAGGINVLRYGMMRNLVLGLEVVTADGSVSAEHGIGTEKLQWLPSSRSADEIAVMQLLKRSLDPANLLNPGRVLNST
jgi:FAD/FMN-containing dehydrogenase